jgi:hypothetical protein
MRTARAVVAALAGAAIAGGLVLVTEPGYALLAATAGALLGVLPERSEPATATTGGVDR